MANARVREIYQYLAVSGEGKKQSAFGVFQPNVDIDVMDKVEVSISDNVDRRDEFDCDGVDLIREAILSRDTVITLNYNEGFTPQIATRWMAYHQGVAASPTGGPADTDEVQTLTYNGSVTGGTHTLALTHEGKTGLTEPIAFDATAAEVQAAMLKKTGTATAMGKLLKAGDVVVTGTWPMTVTFGGRFAGANLALLTVDNALITGGGTIDAAEGTPGSQLVHAISRSTDATLPFFSLITGDKNGSYDHFKYGDCVVESINFSAQQAGGALVGMTVTIFCNYIAERESSYTVPTCVNISPLKVEDIGVSIDGTYETPDVAALNAFFNNNVPREAAFAFDDIDISNGYQRGDQPTQGFTSSIFGTPDTVLYTLAEAEETDGNDVAFILHLGRTGNRLSITGADTKIKFQGTRLGFAGPLRQSTINIEATPYNSPPLAYSANLSQAVAFLVSS